MDSITLDVAGARVTLPAETLTQLWLDQLHRWAAAPLAIPGQPPRIGQPWPGHGGIYAGIARGRAGQPDYFLIVADPAREGVTWDKAKDWAKNMLEAGLADWSLPTRAEQALLFANVPELFEKEWYWSAEPYAGGEQYAWCQYFHNGRQDTNRKGYELRARAVRRFRI